MIKDVFNNTRNLHQGLSTSSAICMYSFTHENMQVSPPVELVRFHKWIKICFHLPGLTRSILQEIKVSYFDNFVMCQYIFAHICSVGVLGI